MFLELASVVGEHVLERKREYLAYDLKEFSSRKGGMRGGRKRVAEAGVEVNERDDVSTRAVDVLFEGVKGNTVSRICGLESVRLSGCFQTFELGDATSAGNPLWCNTQASEIFDDTADRLWFRTCEASFGAVLEEERVQLLLSKVLVFEAEPFQLFDDAGVPDATTFDLWCFRT